MKYQARTVDQLEIGLEVEALQEAGKGRGQPLGCQAQRNTRDILLKEDKNQNQPNPSSWLCHLS